MVRRYRYEEHRVVDENGPKWLIPDVSVDMVPRPRNSGGAQHRGAGERGATPDAAGRSVERAADDPEGFPSMRLLARAATFALAVPLTLAGLAGSAAAAPDHTVTVPGCYGVQLDQLIVCDLTVTVTEPTTEVYNVWVKVCTGQCGYVPVPLVRPGERGEVCYRWFDGAGNPNGGCVGDDQIGHVDPGTWVCLGLTGVCYVEQPSA